MKKLLLISYYFPPLGMGGTQRPLKFAQYLPLHGWQATILTVKPIAYWAQDAGLLQDIPDVPVIRSGSLDPQRLLRLLKGGRPVMPGGGSSRPGLFAYVNNKILPLFLLPDSKILWRPYAQCAGRRLLAQGDFDAVLTTSPPHSLHLIGQSLANKFNLPWVADFRDAWSGSVVVHEPSRWHRRKQKRLQTGVVKSADAVICVSEGIRNDLRQNQTDHEKFHLIPNGFDPADYPSTVKRDDRRQFVVCHCGSITRFSDPQPLFRALQRLRQRHPAVLRRIKFVFVGYDALGNFPNSVAAAGLDDVVSYEGYRTHRQSLEIMSQADALLLVACHDEDAHFIPGKTYEYLGAAKPILTVSNVPDTIDLLQQFPWVTLLRPNDVEEIADILLQWADAGKMARINTELLKPYDRAYQAQQLAAVLDRLTIKHAETSVLGR